MKLKNTFSDETRALFLDAQYCFLCYRVDRGLEGHHIYSRVSNSPFNFAPLCNHCHSHVGHTQAEHIEILKKTVKYLIVDKKYNPTPKDMVFLDSIEKDFQAVRELI